MFLGIPLWLAAEFWLGVSVGLVGVVGGAIVGALAEATPADLTTANAPVSVLRSDCTTFWQSAVGLGVAAGLTTGIGVAYAPGSPWGPVSGISVGCINTLVMGGIFGFIQAPCWGLFASARCWLALARRLPWQLMTFLADAHTNRGVLRQVGATYQFRHIELQRHLATKERNRKATSQNTWLRNIPKAPMRAGRSELSQAR